MAIDKRKILNAAQKFVQKGNFDKAVVEYQKVCKADPKDTSVRLKLGDIYLKLGKNEDAVHAYRKVAEQFMKDGFDAKAVALFKQITKLDPKCHEVSIPLAELYQRMGLIPDAMAALQSAADAAYQAGEKDDALDLLRRMAALEPANTTNRLKVAELLNQEGHTSEAITEYREVLAELERQGAGEEHAQVLARLVEVDPSSSTNALELVQAHLHAGRLAEAETAARALCDREPENLEGREALGLALDGLGRSEECAAIMRDVAAAYRERGDDERARDLVQRFGGAAEFSVDDTDDPILETDEPVDADALEIESDAPMGDLGGAAAAFEDPGFNPEGMHIGESLGGDDGDAAGDLDAAALETDLPDDLELDLSGVDDLDELDEQPSLDAEVAGDMTLEPVVADETPPMAPVPAPEPPEDIDQALAEAGVYLRYGKHDRAIEALRGILAVEPAHAGALLKLGEALVATDDSANAVTAFERAAASADGDVALFESARDQLEAIDPAAAAALSGESESGSLDDVEIEIDDGLDDLDVEVESDEAEVDVEVPADEDAARGADLEETVVDEDFDVSAEAGTGESDGLDAVAELDLDGIEDETPNAESDDSATMGESTTSVQVREELDEAGFYFEQGMFDEAREIYERILQVAPNHPQAMLRLGEIEASAALPDVTPADEARSDDVPLPTVDDFEDSTSGSDDAMGDFEFANDADEQAVDGGADEPLEFNFDEPEAATPTVAPTKLEPEPEPQPEPVVEPAAVATLPPDEQALVVGEDDAFDEEEVLDDEDEVFEVGGSPPSAEAPVAAALPDTTVPMATDESVEVPGVEVPALPTEVVESAPASISVADAGDTFDLAAQLSDAFDDDDAHGAGSSSGNLGGTEDEGFEQVFAAFKQGVQSELGEGDHEAHYDLGIAYKEMGLIEDAIGEFQQAMQAPGRALPCLHMMGLCAFDLGRLTDAVANFEQALSLPDLPEDQQMALRFDLGRAFAQSGDVARARSCFEAVQAVDPDFCDVGSLLADLDSGEVAPVDADSEVFESFDDLLDESDAEAEDETTSGNYESFDEFMDDDDDDDEGADAGSAMETPPGAEPEIVADATPEPVEAEPVAEPVADPSPDADMAEKPKRGKRKKISFV